MFVLLLGLWLLLGCDNKMVSGILIYNSVLHMVDVTFVSYCRIMNCFREYFVSSWIRSFRVKACNNTIGPSALLSEEDRTWNVSFW